MGEWSQCLLFWIYVYAAESRGIVFNSVEFIACACQNPNLRPKRSILVFEKITFSMI